MVGWGFQPGDSDMKGRVCMLFIVFVWFEVVFIRVNGVVKDVHPHGILGEWDTIHVRILFRFRSRRS